MKAYERLLKYVKVYTVSDPKSQTVPSTMRQFDLACVTAAPIPATVFSAGARTEPACGAE